MGRKRHLRARVGAALLAISGLPAAWSGSAVAADIDATAPYPASVRSVLTIPTPSLHALDPQVTVRPDGRQLLLWREWNERAKASSLYVSTRRSLTQPWRRMARLTTRLVSDVARIATGPDGTTAVLWKDGPKVAPSGVTYAGILRLRIMPPGGARWSRTYTIDDARHPHGIRDFAVTVAPDGDVTVVWLRSRPCGADGRQVCGSLSALTLERASGTLRNRRTLDAVADDLDITRSPDGSITAAWAKGLDFMAARLPAGAGAWSAPAQVSPSDWLGASGTARGHVQAGPDGRVLYVWELARTTRAEVQRDDLSAAVLDPATGKWSAPVVLADRGDDDGRYEPIVTLDPEGRFVVVAAVPTSSGTSLIAFTSADGVTWTRATVLARKAPDATYRFVATASGPPAILYAASNGRSERLWLIARDGAGPGWRPPIELSRNARAGMRGIEGRLLPYSGATGPDGTFIAAWEQRPFGVMSATVIRKRTPARVRLRLHRWTLRNRTHRLLEVRVASGFLRPRGQAVVTIDGSWRRRVKVRDGVGTVRLPRLGRGRHVATATFTGNRVLAPARARALTFR